MPLAIIDFCPEVLYLTGGCTTQACTLRHDVRFCDICGVICSPARVFASHARGQLHRQRSATFNELVPQSLTCSICDITVSGQVAWYQHVADGPHRATAASKGCSPLVLPLDPNLSNGLARCLLCKRVIPKQDELPHLRSVLHRQMERYASYQSTFELAERNKRGIEVSHKDGLDFGVVEVAEARRGVQVNLQLTMMTTSGSVTVVSAVIHGSPGATPSPFTALMPGALTLTHGRNIDLPIQLAKAERGRFAGRIEIVFKDLTNRRFVIARSVKATVGSQADHQRLRPTERFVRRRPAPWRQGPITPGIAPPALDAVPYVGKLPKAKIPGHYAALLTSKEPASHIADSFRVGNLPQILDHTTHTAHFRALLWVEEFTQQRDLRMYDLAGVQLAREGSLYRLPVLGLAEKRPSVVVGDIIETQVPESAKIYQGVVHFVRQHDVLLGFSPSFRPTAGQAWSVRFTFNRVVVRRQHEALLTQPRKVRRLLFPGPNHIGLSGVPAAATVPITPFNQLVANNPGQMQAIRSIIKSTANAAPFIVFGPPGTGKTVTIVEAIRQILHRQPQARILACAPSNSAADIIAQRLTMLRPAELLRFYAVSRSRTDAPQDLLNFIYTNTQGTFSVPPMDQLKQYKVIVSTCCAASFAHGVKVPLGHFTHIFVDEAGQGLEPEVLIPIKTMAAPSTKIILSGDPKQLGPVVRSAVARELGLGVSYLERLMDFDVYNEDSGSGKTLVKLLKNFRSHSTILTYPNAKFYKNELEVCGAPQSINSFIGSAMLVNPTFPVVFHAIAGTDEREGSSPSYFNIDEISEVRDRILQLLADDTHPIESADIGVITPYYGQARKLRQAFRAANLTDVKVGTVEEFQGQERRVIFISTVRSSRDLVQYDLRHTLGFVANPRRFNVAVTRAKALLYIVGDPAVLGMDPLWRGFMNYVYLNGGWRGDTMVWDPHAAVHEQGGYDQELRDMGAASLSEFLQRVEELGGVGENADGSDMEEAEANVEVPVDREGQ